MRGDQSRNEYVAHALDLLRGWAPVAARRMFSGHGLYRGDVIFALIVDDVLYFKTDAVNRPAYEAAGMAPFSYMRAGRPAVIASYHAVPTALLEGEGELGEWAEQAFAAALRVRKAKMPRRKQPARRRRKSG